MKIKITDEDIAAVFTTVQQQAKEDREAVKEIYDDLSLHVKGSPERYAVSGDTLAKYADLLIKQTGQNLEILKIFVKQQEGSKDDAFSSDDLDKIREAIESDE